MQQSDVFIWGGGSLMQDSTSFASPVYYAGLMALAQQRGLKTIAWAQGIGPLNKSFTRWLTKQVLLGCDAVSVRDTASAALLTSLRSHPLLTAVRLKTLVQAIQDFQAQTDTFILLIPFQPAQDNAIAEQIAVQLEQDFTIMSIINPKQLKGLFKNVKMAIGMRLHSLIMAAAAECSCFVLSYDPKVTQLMSELNLPGYELANLPQEPQIISSAWLKQYYQGQAMKQISIQSLIDRALIHQHLLKKVMINS